VKKESVRRGFVVMQQPVFFVAKVWSDVFAHIHAVAIKRHSGMKILLFVLPIRILYEQPA
jgi:hypothetical protein